MQWYNRNNVNQRIDINWIRENTTTSNLQENAPILQSKRTINIIFENQV